MNIQDNNVGKSVSILNNKDNCVVCISSPQNVLTRPVTQCKEIQDGRMMYFQQLVMKEARAALRAKSFQVFNQQMSIEVELSSKTTPSSIKLEMLLKTILDSLNGHVIKDDSLVMNARITHIRSLNRYPKTTIKVEIINLRTKEALYFTLDLPGIEKAIAVPYDIDGEMKYDASYNVALAGIEIKLSSLFSSCTRFNKCHILINTSKPSSDVDNLALLYLEILRKHNVFDSNRIGEIGMYKRHTTQEEEGVVINLFHEV